MSIDFTWSAPDGSDSFPVPGEVEARTLDGADEADADALMVLEAAGLFFDQLGPRVRLGGAPMRVAVGRADVERLAEAVWNAMERGTMAMAIGARALPLRITEVPELPQRVLVVDSERTGPVQVPIEPEAIEDALEVAVSLLEAGPPVDADER
jgi:hypothetical protein